MRKIAMLLVVAFLMGVVMPVFAGQPKIVINGLNSGDSASSQSSSESGVTPGQTAGGGTQEFGPQGEAPRPTPDFPAPSPEPKPYAWQRL